MAPIYVKKDSANDDIWDDTLIIKAYEESMKLAKEEVARRIASATNKKSSDSGGAEQKPQKSDKPFQVGDFCRATFEDGVDYEARIVRINSEGNICVIKYVGYGNEESKAVKDLMPSWGKKQRKQQKQTAARGGGVGGSATSESGIGAVLFDRSNSEHICDSPGIMVPPPPPMPPILDENPEEAEHLSAMLMSWYMSGYYTGLYQGQKMAQRKQNQ